MNWSELFSPCYKAADPGLLENFENHLGTQLPEQYRSFLSKYGGGSFELEHEMPHSDSNNTAYIQSLWPLSMTFPGIGIIEARSLDEKGNHPIPTLLRIGDDGGTGFFLIGLRHSHRGKVFFAFKENHWFPSIPQDSACHIAIPEDYEWVCDRFDDLPAIVWKYRI